MIIIYNLLVHTPLEISNSECEELYTHVRVCVCVCVQVFITNIDILADKYTVT
jgi:hypothetical protein